MRRGSDSVDRLPWRIAAGCGLCVLTGGVLSIAGWAFDLPRLTDLTNVGVSIQPNGSVAALLAGAAVLLLLVDRPTIAVAVGSIVGIISVTTLLEHLFHADFGIDTLLLFDRSWGQARTVYPGRMGVPASLSWSMLGAALVLNRVRRTRRIAPFVALLVACIAGLSLTGFAYNADPLYTVPRLTSISLQTAAFLLVSAAGLLFAMADREPCRTLFEDSGAGLLARRSVPIMIGLPLVLGYLRLRGQRLGLYDTAMGAAIFAWTILIVLCVVMWRAVRAIRQRERALLSADDATRVANDALRESEARLTALLEQLPIGVGVFGPDGRWIIDNPVLHRYVGKRLPSLEPEQARRWQAWTEDGEPLPPSEWPGPRALRGETVEPGVTFLHTADDGTERWFRVSAAPFLAHDGRRLGAIALLQDIDEHKRARDALAESEERLREQAAELHESARRKDEFLATLAHELRNPLAPIRTGLQMLKVSGATAGSAERTLTIMERQINHLVRLIDDLLDVGRVTHGRITLESAQLDLADVVRQAIDTASPAIGAADHTLTLSAPAEPILVDADEARLVQIFGNLLNNAAKFTPPGGRIEVALRKEDGQAVVTVRDTGVGIPPEMIGRVFDLFTQVDRSLIHAQSGLGIGLSLVKGLVELHGGSVEGNSEGPGKGSTFTVRLPISQRAPTAPAVPAPAVNAPRCRILVVDDNVDAADSLGALLRVLGHDTETAYDGLSAIAAAAANVPDVILLDIGMPGLNGYETGMRIREQHWGKSVRLIALTGWGQEQDRHRSFAAGFDGHLVKPTDPTTLTNILRDVGVCRS
jgi:PAS domain S-box-containing protein